MCHPSFCSISWNLRVQIRSPFLNQGTQGYIGTHIIDTNALLKLPKRCQKYGLVELTSSGIQWRDKLVQNSDSIFAAFFALYKITPTQKGAREHLKYPAVGTRERELCIEGTLQNVSGFWVQYTQYFVHCTKTKKPCIHLGGSKASRVPSD